MQREITNKLAEELLSGWIHNGETLRIGLADDRSGLVFETVSAPAPEAAAPAETAAETAAEA